MEDQERQQGSKRPYADGDGGAFGSPPPPLRASTSAASARLGHGSVQALPAPVAPARPPAVPAAPFPDSQESVGTRAFPGPSTADADQEMRDLEAAEAAAACTPSQIAAMDSELRDIEEQLRSRNRRAPPEPRALRFWKFMQDGTGLKPVRCTPPPPPSGNDVLLQGGALRAAFPAKYPGGPQPPQREAMEAVAEALLGRKNAFVEAPTGTGKALALLCTSLAFQSQKFEEAQAAGGDPAAVPRVIFASRTQDQLVNLAREMKELNAGANKASAERRSARGLWDSARTLWTISLNKAC